MQDGIDEPFGRGEAGGVGISPGITAGFLSW